MKLLKIKKEIKDFDTNTILKIRNLTKEFNGNVVLRSIDLNIHTGEFITLLGPSGCGKTTLLRIIAGFEKPNSGEIFCENKKINSVPTYKRPINTIFQNYALFPHLNVFDNVSYGLKIRKIPKTEIMSKVVEMLKLVNLESYIYSDVNSLSGGQKQRVAIARALIVKPKILLLDEPFSALDKKLRIQMQSELKRIQEKVKITFIFVTHDQEEALTMSDRIVVLNNGLIKQIGTPEVIYDEPENKWVAQFIGQSNIIENGLFIKNNKVSFDNMVFTCDAKGFGENEYDIDIVLRPEDIEIVDEKNAFFSVKVISANFKGVYWELKAESKFRIYLIHTTENILVNKIIWIRWREDYLHVMWKEIDM